MNKNMKEINREIAGLGFLGRVHYYKFKIYFKHKKLKDKFRKKKKKEKKKLNRTDVYENFL